MNVIACLSILRASVNDTFEQFYLLRPFNEQLIEIDVLRKMDWYAFRVAFGALGTYVEKIGSSSI